MARAPVLAAGGIVLRQAEPPLVAVVRLRKGNEWCLPKGKLDHGEAPRHFSLPAFSQSRAYRGNGRDNRD